MYVVKYIEKCNHGYGPLTTQRIKLTIKKEYSFTQIVYYNNSG